MLLEEGREGYLEDEVFKTIIQNTPLVSVDLIVKNNDDMVLLGKRINKPAEGYWFTLGGRVLKNEKIEDAIRRISKIELNIELHSSASFIGIFEHIYDDGIFNDTSTHYINIAYEIKLDRMNSLPKDQHDEYKWFTIKELLISKDVHPFVKDYFTKELGSIPQRKKVKI